MILIYNTFMNIDINKSFTKFPTWIKLIPTKLQTIKHRNFKIVDIDISNIEIWEIWKSIKT